jgi:hypothetical protein
MIICSECGNAAPSQDGFCTSCGALLEWAGEKVETVPARPDRENAQGTPRQPAVEAARPGPEPLVVEPEYTGSYCWSCGARNAEGRVFCRACGEQLSRTAAQEPRPSWWRRFLARFHRGRPRAAGERPSGFRRHDASEVASGSSAAKRRPRLHRNRRLPLSRLAPLLAVLALLGIGLGPARAWVTTRVFGVVQNAQQRLHEQYVPDSPVNAAASSSLPGHGAALAIDGVSTTYWATDDKGDGVGDTLTVHFATAVNISRVGLLSGEPGAAFRSEPRPESMTLTATGNTPARISFIDSAQFQNAAVGLKRVTVLTITFDSVYPGQQGHDMAVSEIQFFTLG